MIDGSKKRNLSEVSSEYEIGTIITTRVDTYAAITCAKRGIMAVELASVSWNRCESTVYRQLNRSDGHGGSKFPISAGHWVVSSNVAFLFPLI